jgi:hypothetical protein
MNLNLFHIGSHGRKVRPLLQIDALGVPGGPIYPDD